MSRQKDIACVGCEVARYNYVHGKISNFVYLAGLEDCSICQGTGLDPIPIAEVIQDVVEYFRDHGHKGGIRKENA